MPVRMVSVTLEAEKHGISSLCPTEHVDLLPSDPRFANYSHEAAVERLRKLHSQDHRGIALGLVVQISYRVEAEEQIRQFIADNPLDLVIGSVHNISGLFVREWLASTQKPGLPARERFQPYFDLLQHMAHSGMFQILGHLDYVKRYESELRSEQLFELFRDELAEIIKTQMAHGGIIELNISGLRHFCRETYPSAQILTLYHDMGGRVVTLGSDAHARSHLDLPLSIGAEIAESIGLRYVDWHDLEA